MSRSTKRKSKRSSTLIESTPAKLGYRMPGKFEPIPWVYAEIIRHLVRHERVELVVNNAAAARKARKILVRADALSEHIRFHRWPTNRVWLRDSGCIFLKATHVESHTAHVGTSATGRPV